MPKRPHACGPSRRSRQGLGSYWMPNGSPWLCHRYSMLLCTDEYHYSRRRRARCSTINLHASDYWGRPACGRPPGELQILPPRRRRFPVRPDDPVQLKLKDSLAKTPADCGRLDVRAPNEKLASASNCATKAAQEKHPFTVGYDVPGMSTGIPETLKENCLLFSCRERALERNWRVARVRLSYASRKADAPRVSSGTMGLTPTSADPHGGIPMSPAGGMNPQGGMIPQPFAPPPKKK
jgi:hypothetical protein